CSFVGKSSFSGNRGETVSQSPPPWGQAPSPLGPPSAVPLRPPPGMSVPVAGPGPWMPPPGGLIPAPPFAELGGGPWPPAPEDSPPGVVTALGIASMIVALLTFVASLATGGRAAMFASQLLRMDSRGEAVYIIVEDEK